MLKFTICLLSFLALVPFSPSLDAQEATEFEHFFPETERRSLVPENPEPLSRQFRALHLGMGIDDLKTALINDQLFHFRGDRDVSFLPIREETLVETTGGSFIRRAHFQLTDEAVYIMSFTLNTRLIDHYSVFTAFLGRYGEPLSLNPHEAIWETDEIRVSIERPLTVKYLDRIVFERLTEESRAIESHEMLRREEFLADF